MEFQILIRNLWENIKDVANHNGKQEWLPENIDAVEFAAAVLKHTFSSFDRPVYYEPVNEPHWALDRYSLCKLAFKNEGKDS